MGYERYTHSEKVKQLETGLWNIEKAMNPSDQAHARCFQNLHWLSQLLREPGVAGSSRGTGSKGVEHRSQELA